MHRGMKTLCSILLLFSVLVTGGLQLEQQEFSGFFDFKAQFDAADIGDRQALIDSYLEWQTEQGFPAIENDTHAVFIYYSSTGTSTVSVAGDMNGWSPEEMTALPGFNFQYLVFETFATARVDYKLVVGSNWILDPRNPKTVSGGFGPNSELAMPDFIQPAEILPASGESVGVMTTIPSENMTWEGAKPNLRVYTPPNYNESESYRTVYFADGLEYINLGAAKNVLDNLILEERIEPVVAVFADPYGPRHTWYDCSKNDYLVYLDVLVPYIDSNFATINDSAARVHIGDSLGGQITAHVGLNRSSLFSLLGIHSGAFWDGYSPSLGYQIGCQIKDKFSAADPELNLTLYLTAGYYEGSIWDDTKTVETYITAKGWKNNISYLYEGHSWGQWRHTLNDMLEYLVPAPVQPEDTTTPTATNITSSESEITSSSSSIESSSSNTEGTDFFFGNIVMICIAVLIIIRFRQNKLIFT